MEKMEGGKKGGRNNSLKITSKLKKLNFRKGYRDCIKRS